jgi:hypothetical protein
MLVMKGRTVTSKATKKDRDDCKDPQDWSPKAEWSSGYGKK